MTYPPIVSAIGSRTTHSQRNTHSTYCGREIGSAWRRGNPAEPSCRSCKRIINETPTTLPPDGMSDISQSPVDPNWPPPPYPSPHYKGEPVITPAGPGRFVEIDADGRIAVTLSDPEHRNLGEVTYAPEEIHKPTPLNAMPAVQQHHPARAVELNIPIKRGRDYGRANSRGSNRTN